MFEIFLYHYVTTMLLISINDLSKGKLLSSDRYRLKVNIEKLLYILDQPENLIRF